MFNSLQVIVAVGGEDDKVVLRSVECFCPSSNIWYTLASLPFAVRYAYPNDKYPVTESFVYLTHFHLFFFPIPLCQTANTV